MKVIFSIAPWRSIDIRKRIKNVWLPAGVAATFLKTHVRHAHAHTRIYNLKKRTASRGKKSKNFTKNSHFGVTQEKNQKYSCIKNQKNYWQGRKIVIYYIRKKLFGIAISIFRRVRKGQAGCTWEARSAQKLAELRQIGRFMLI